MSKQNARVIVLEFYGMPAAGKTYTARQIADELDRNGIIINTLPLRVGQMHSLRRITLKLWLIFWAVLRHAKLCFSAILLVKVSRPSSNREFARICFNWLYVIGLVIRQRSRDGVLLMDQGLIQAAWSTAYISEAEIDKRYYNFISKLQSCLRVSLIAVKKEADMSTLRNRLSFRTDSNSPLDRGKDGDTDRALSVTRKIEKLISDEIGSDISNTHLVIGGNSATKDDIALVLKVVRFAKE